MATTVFMTGANKTGTMVTITVRYRNFPITFDMTTGQYTSYTGRTVKRFPCSAVEANGLSHIDKLLISATRGGVEALSRLELFLGQPDLLETVQSICDLPAECPKGFIKWVREKQKPLNDNSLHEFKIVQTLRQQSKEDLEVYELLTMTEDSPADSFFVGGKKLIDWYLTTDSDTRKIFNKILKVSQKGFSWNFARDMIIWLQNFTSPTYYSHLRGVSIDNPIQYADTNRSFAWNNKMIEEIAESQVRESIISKEDIIRPIETLSNEQFTVIVPSSLQDFTDEGKQQGNCVGSHYHKSIAEGLNLIYFIRKTKTPDKSYITNRFNIHRQKTVETKKQFNHPNDDKDAIELINRIDEMIRTLI